MNHKGLIFFILTLVSVYSYGQYPKLTDADKAKEKVIMEGAERHSDSVWQHAVKIVRKEAREGKPYVPWAFRPIDLPQAKIPSFPGAQGGGMYSYGGRGGKVITVTSLADKGPGTLREALETGGARIIVFNVAGKIELKSQLIIRAPYVTIAGQTAPGDGVVVAGETVWINTHDVVIRHMRFRRGETFVGRRDDAIGGNPVGNIMIDHVSASWGLDENMSIYRHMYSPGGDYKEEKLGTVNVTIQNSIFSEGLDTYNHSLGSTLGGENCSFMRNLWASNAGRNPSIGWNGIFNFANNVVFNWSHRTTDGGDYKAKFNIINNYYKPGPITSKDRPVAHRILKPEAGLSDLDTLIFGRAYVKGNFVEGFPKVSSDNWNGGVQIEGKDGELMTYEEAKVYFPYIKADDELPRPWFKIMPTKDAYNFVLENAGATLPKRDPVDVRIIKTVKTGKAIYEKGLDPDSFYQFKHRRLPPDSYKRGIITDIAQVGGYPEYKGKPYTDSDGDGMPDAYEKKFNLDPNDPSDATSYPHGKDGYTQIEYYINGIDPNKKVDWSDLENNEDTLAEQPRGLNTYKK